MSISNMIYHGILLLLIILAFELNEIAGQCSAGTYPSVVGCQPCSTGCLPVASGGATCDSNNGHCFSGCAVGYTGGLLCKDCDTNYFRAGGSCYQCNDNCIGSCDPNTGSCNSGCKAGYYGDRCGDTCSIHCAELQCDFTSGACSAQGCRDGYYGSLCETPCGRCACDRNTGSCSGRTCNIGYFGAECTNTCSQFCDQNACEKLSGNCTLPCPTGYYGPFCSRNCSTTCFGNACERSDGKCSGACVAGYYGDYCNNVCGINCAMGSCLKTTGTCNGDCTTGFYGVYCDQPCSSSCKGSCAKSTGYCDGAAAVTGDDTSSSNLALIVGVSCAGGVVLLIIIIGVACCQRRQSRHQHKKRMILEMGNGNGWTFDDERMSDPNQIRYEKMSALNYSVNGSSQHYNGVARQSEINYAFDDQVKDDVYVTVSAEVVPVDQFPKYVARLTATDMAFQNQHESLPTGLTDTHEEALKLENHSKNRYKNIYPYDNSRVILETDEDQVDSGMDYINASRIEGFESSKTYIAAQGPTEHTVDDFWRMIWQEVCSNIVMLTNSVEGGVMKCKKYWPEEKQMETYGKITVTNNYKEEYADFTITNLTVMNSGGKLEVRHLHFTSWPDKDVPQYVTPMVEFSQIVRSYIDDTPLLVHCSAGIGRSGTFIALDKLLDQAASEDRISVYQCVFNMRKERVNMIQTAEQYKFLHEALLEAIQSRNITVTREEFRQYFDSMMEYTPGSSERKLDKQFKRIKSTSDHINTEAALLPENSHKNRNQNILASDDCRVFLWSSIHGSNDYINAIHVPNYRNRYAYIITEMPQYRTLIDFCRLVHQEECRTIINMDLEEGDESEDSGKYWTETNQSVGCGPFQMIVTDTKTKGNFICRSIDFKYNVGNVNHNDSLNLIDDKGTVSIRQYQVTCWPRECPAPSSAEALIDLIHDVAGWQDLSGNHPILVHCMNGAYRSGLMCLALTCCDRLRTDGDVCVPHALSHLRARRPQVVPYFPQYKFCHEVITKFIEKGE